MSESGDENPNAEPGGSDTGGTTGDEQDASRATDEQLNAPAPADTDSGAASASGDHGQQDLDDPGTLSGGQLLPP